MEDQSARDGCWLGIKGTDAVILKISVEPGNTATDTAPPILSRRTPGRNGSRFRDILHAEGAAAGGLAVDAEEEV